MFNPPILLFILLNGFRLMTLMEEESPELGGKERGTWLDSLCLRGPCKETVSFHLPRELCSLLLLLPLVNDVPQIVTSLHNNVSNKIVNCEDVMLGQGVWHLCKDQKPQ